MSARVHPRRTHWLFLGMCLCLTGCGRGKPVEETQVVIDPTLDKPVVKLVEPPPPSVEPLPRPKELPPRPEPPPPGFDFANFYPSNVYPISDRRVLGLNERDAVLWDLVDGKHVTAWRYSPRIPEERRTSSLSPDATRLAVIDFFGARCLFHQYAAVAGGPYALSHLGDPGAWARVGRIIDLTTYKSVLLTSPANIIDPTLLAWSPTGDRVLLADRNLGADVNRPTFLRLFDTATGKEAGVIGARLPRSAYEEPAFKPSEYGLVRRSVYAGMIAHAVERVLFSPDGRHLLTLAGTGTGDPVPRMPLHIWDGRDGSLRANLAMDYRKLHTASFSPDSKRLALVVHDRNELGVESARVVRVVDPETGATLAALPGSRPPDAFCWTPDSKRLVIATESDRIRCLEAETGDEVWNVPRPRETSLGPFTHQPGGSLIAFTVVETDRTTDKRTTTLHVLDSATGKPAWTVKGVEAAGYLSEVVTWSPDGKYVVRGVIVPAGTDAAGVTSEGNWGCEVLNARNGQVVTTFGASSPNVHWHPSSARLARLGRFQAHKEEKSPSTLLPWSWKPIISIPPAKPEAKP